MLPFISYDAWKGQVFRDLCTKPIFANRIIDMVQEKVVREPEQPQHYDILAACYEKAGQKELALINHEKVSQLRARQVNQFTRKKYSSILSILAEHPDIQAVLVQYPLRDIFNLKQLAKGAVGYDRILFVDNKKAF